MYGSSYIPTSLVIWSFQLLVHIIKNLLMRFDLALQIKCKHKHMATFDHFASIHEIKVKLMAR